MSVSIEAHDRFAPSEDFAAQANATSALYGQADADREAFWAEQASRLQWDSEWNQ
ncbi:acetyl-coenzyme A synthetase N-terminal domain-containing protein, partial [Saccharopolyspora aridisoli]|uniref:acetyl-coenzyme A synthetase N-terminal domain-containing protein n=1 Tax=Saccharopolyspora aridisoli TaxID=2530385 RepID=UPI002E255DCB